MTPNIKWQRVITVATATSAAMARGTNAGSNSGAPDVTAPMTYVPHAEHRTNCARIRPRTTDRVQEYPR